MPMNRTPIKIPGKNKRDNSKAAIAARKALNRPRGRPLKMTSSTRARQASPPETKDANVPKKRSLKNIKSRRKMSNLERLPTELLVDIFLYSLNLNLPRSSPVIAGKLTSDLVYTGLIATAFGPTWEDGYGKVYDQPLILTEPTDIDEGPRINHQTFGIGDRELQSAILRCRWASLPILQKCQSMWIDEHGKERRFHPIPFTYDIHIDTEDAFRREMLQRQLTPTTFFEEDFTAFSSYANGYTGEELSFQWYTYADVAKNLEIPQSLLLGPWNEEKTRFLFWLVKGGAKLNWLTSTSGEAAIMGLKNAIVDGDLRVIHLLTWAGLQERVDIETLLWAIRHAANNRYDVVDSVFSIFFIFHDLGSEEQWTIGKAVAEMKDQAIVEKDEDTIAFLKRVKELFRIKD